MHSNAEAKKKTMMAFLDWPIGKKLLVSLMLLMLIFVQKIGYIAVILKWDTNHTYVNPNIAIHLLHVCYLFLLVCLIFFVLINILIHRQQTKSIKRIQYLYVVVSAIMLFYTDLYTGFLSFSSGLIGISIPLFMLVVFDKKLAYFTAFVSALGFLICGYIIIMGYIAINVFFINITLSDPQYKLFHLLTSLYFAAPMMLVILFSFDYVLRYWRLRENEFLKISRTDTLTGLLNRRAIHQTLRDSIASAQKNTHPICIILVDIDHFKQINDTHGHLVGDSVIALIGIVLQSSIRQKDCVGRYGGEEFLMVLNNTHEHTAAAIAERCRIKLEQFCFETPTGEIINITASFGVSYQINGTHTIKQMLGNADKQLYRAKASGRNCVCIQGSDQ